MVDILRKPKEAITGGKTGKNRNAIFANQILSLKKGQKEKAINGKKQEI